MLPDLLFGRRGIAKVVHLWLPVAVLLSLDPPANPVETLRAAAFLLVAAGCFTQVCILVNDLCDRREDGAAGKERWIRRLPVSGAVSLLTLTAGLGGAALALVGGQRWALGVYGAALALGIAYSVPPLRLKTRGMAGPAAYAAATAAAYALLPGVVLNGASGAVGVLLAVVFLDKLVHLLQHQVADHDTDRQSGTETFVVVTGLGRARSLLRWISWLAILSFAAVTALLLRSGRGSVAAAVGCSAAAGLAAAFVISRGTSAAGASFARQLPPLYLGLGFSTVRLLPSLLLAGTSIGIPRLWPVFLTAAATAVAELASYGRGLLCRRRVPVTRVASTADGRTLGWLAVSGFAVAVGVRVFLLGDKPFWRDEAWVALLSREQLPAILSALEPTPVGFVLLVKLAGQLPWLPPEITLRLVPLLCGLAAVVVLPRLVRSLGASPIVAVTALLFAAGAPPLVYYSRELKHYGVDLLLAMLVPLLSIRFFGLDADADNRAAPGTGARLLLVALLIGPWVSFGSAFPIVATLFWGWLRPWRGATPTLQRQWATFTLLYGLSLTVVFTFFIQRQAVSPGLLYYWDQTFAQQAALTLPIRFGHAVFDYVRVPLSYFFPGMEPVALPLAIIGLARWPRPRAATLWWLSLATLFLTVAAVLADRYVLAAGRFLLFTSALLLMSVAAGLAELGRLLQPLVGRRVATAAPLVVGAVAALSWSATAVAHRLPPYRNDIGRYFRYDTLHDVEPLIAAVDRRAGPGEPVLVSHYSRHAFGYYAHGRLPGATILTKPTESDALRHILRTWAGMERGWILLLDEEVPAFDKAVADEGFRRLLVASARGSRLWEIRSGR